MRPVPPPRLLGYPVAIAIVTVALWQTGVSLMSSFVTSTVVACLGGYWNHYRNRHGE